MQLPAADAAANDLVIWGISCFILISVALHFVCVCDQAKKIQFLWQQLQTDVNALMDSDLIPKQRGERLSGVRQVCTMSALVAH